ncbi:hypothetical protein V6Z11_A08G203000 [Gossypium hirsutum]
MRKENRKHSSRGMKEENKREKRGNRVFEAWSLIVNKEPKTSAHKGKEKAIED